jgi:uncharacterized protein YutE (UPF0331/DUF86 family)
LVDREAFDGRLRLLDRRVALLREIAAAGRERFLSDPHLQAEAERHLQIAIQAAIDAGHQLLAEEFSEAPETYRQVFERLGHRGVIDTALAARLALAAGLRNVLVHAYLEIDPELIWAGFEQLDDLVELARSLTGWLDRAERP